MRASRWERDQVRSYFESQLPDDPVVHFEKVASERVAGVPHDIWDVHCASSRWWALTNPLNFYSQADFKSRDVALTFHVGLAVRLASERNVPITGSAAALLPGAWRRWEQAVEVLGTAREAEDFQAVGVRLRECLVSFAGEIANVHQVAEGEAPPKGADVVGWTNLLADNLASGPSAECLRSYLKQMTGETWGYVNWLTHAKNAGNYDAEIGAAAVSHLLATVTALRLRWAQRAYRRCEECDSYSIAAGRCQRCGRVDPNYEPPPVENVNKDELASRLAEPCTPSSDISTFITLDDVAARPGTAD